MAPNIFTFLIAMSAPPPFPFHFPFHTSPKDPNPTRSVDSRSSGITSNSLLERDREVGSLTSGCALLVCSLLVISVAPVIVNVSTDVDVEVVVSEGIVAEAIVVIKVVVLVTYASISKQITRFGRGRMAEGEEEKREKRGTTCEVAMSSCLKGMRLKEDICCGILLKEETSCFINEHICKIE